MHEVLPLCLFVSNCTLHFLRKPVKRNFQEESLLKRKSEFKDRIIAIKDMEIAAQKRAFEDMKEVSDRALKLAETSKPTSNWQLRGLLGLAAFVVGVLIAQ